MVAHEARRDYVERPGPCGAIAETRERLTSTLAARETSGAPAMWPDALLATIPEGQTKHFQPTGRFLLLGA